MNVHQKKSIVVNLLYVWSLFYIVSAPVFAIDKERLKTEISVFENESEVVEYFELLSRFDDVDERYRQDKWAGSQEEIVVVSSCGRGLMPGSVLKNHQINVEKADYKKQIGDYLVVIEQGVLFSVLVEDDELSLKSEIDIAKHLGGDDSNNDGLFILDRKIIVIANDHETDRLNLLLFEMDDQGAISFTNHYNIGTLGESFFGVHSVSLINDKLVMVHDGYLEGLNEEALKLTSLVGVEVVNGESEEVDFIESRQWVDSVGDVRVEGTYTDVISCALDDGLSCNTTTILGVDGYNYITEDAVYIWAKSNQGIDYSKVSFSEYYQMLSDSDGEGYSSDNFPLYKVGVNSGNVEAVLVKGAPISSYTFRENESHISALTHVPEEQEGGLLYGMYFTKDIFSSSSVELSDEHYQYLNDSIYTLTAHNFIGETIVIAYYLNNEAGDTASYEMLVWNYQTGYLDSFSSKYEIKSLHDLDGRVLAMSTHDNGLINFDIWSAKSEFEKLSSNLFEMPFYFNNRNTPYIESDVFDFGQTVALPVFRIDDQGEFIEYQSTNGETKRLVDVAYFNSLNSIAFERVGQVEESLDAIEESCKVECGLFSHAYPISMNNKLLSMINGELILSDYNSGRVHAIERLNLRNKATTVRESLYN